MKTTKPIVILLSLVLLIAAGAQSDEKSEAQKISETYLASCLVKITTDEAVLPLNEFAVDYLLRSSGVAGKAAREVLDIPSDIASELFTCEEIYSLDSDPYGGFGIPTTTSGLSTLGTATTRRPTPTRRTPTTPARTTTTPRPTTPTRTPTRRPTKAANPPLSSAEQTILFHLRVDFSQVSPPEPLKPAAEEFMVALIDNLRSALRGAFDQYSAKLNKQLKLAGEEAMRAEYYLIDMQAKLREISGSRDLSRNVILRDISSLRQILQSAKMERVSDRTLYEATAKRIAEEQVRRKKLVEDDTITMELKSILDVHEKRLGNTQKRYKLGEVSIADVEDVKEKIIRARIELAKRQEEVSNPPGGIVISSLNNELANLSTKAAVAQQEIHSFEEQLEDAEKRLFSADQYELLSLKADIARKSLEETLLWRARLGRNNRSIQPPDVTVIGAE